MAISQSTRLGGYRWTAGTDEFTREQLDASHENYETRVGTFYSGTLASRPSTSLSTTYARSFYLATDQNSPTGILYYCTGTAWVAVNSFAAPGAVTPGDTSSAGTATTIARSDHQHSFLGFATGTSAVSTAASAGAASTFSRGDHVHAVANGAVAAGKIAAGAVNQSTIFTAGVVNSTAIQDNAVTRQKIVETERIPVGTIIPYVGLTAPTGWMMCEGGQVSATSTLGVLLGSRYNTGGETAGNVRVPDLRSRVARGGASGGAWIPSVPATGGSSSVTLTINEVPSHNHGVGTLAVASGGAHTHDAGTIGANNASIDHTHSMAHTHSLGPNEIPDASFGPKNPYAYQVWAVKNGNGIYNIPVVYTGGNCSAEVLVKNSGSWVTTGASPDTTGGMSANSTHGHTLTGSTTQNGSHFHSISGNTGNAGTASPSSISLVPQYAGTSFIIKL